MSKQTGKTPAMVLQEFTMRKGYAPPEYVLVQSRTGTHDNEFHYLVNVAHTFGKGFGRSKQAAKHQAAQKALDKLAELNLYDPLIEPANGFNIQSHRNESESPLTPPVNFRRTLDDKCHEWKLPFPDYIEISDIGPPHCRLFTYQCSLASIVTQATANTKKQAKQLAAKDMLEKIRDICPQLPEPSAEIGNALTDKDQEALSTYADLQGACGITLNRAIKVENFTETFVKIMNERQLKFEDFSKLFSNKSTETFQTVLAMLEVSHEIKYIQENPCIVAVVLGVETPFTAIGVGTTRESAEYNAKINVLNMLEVYMNLPLTSSSIIKYDLL